MEKAARPLGRGALVERERGVDRSGSDRVGATIGPKLGLTGPEKGKTTFVKSGPQLP